MKSLVVLHGMGYLFDSEIEDSVENQFLAYKMAILPEELQEELQKLMEKYSSGDMSKEEFWEEIILIFSKDDSEMADAIQDIVEKLNKNQ